MPPEDNPNNNDSDSGEQEGKLPSSAVHQCARFSANPKTKHAEAVKRIGRYLLATKDKGLTMKPDKNGLECWVDSAHNQNGATRQPAMTHALLDPEWDMSLDMLDAPCTVPPRCKLRLHYPPLKLST
jgi:hypothetical protein